MEKTTKEISEQEILKQKLEALQHSDERYRIASENSNEIIMDYFLEDGSIHHATDMVEKIYGTPQHLDNAVSYLLERGVILPEYQETFLGMMEGISEGKPKVECTLKTRTRTGDIRWNHLVFVTVFNRENRPVRAVGVLKDITAQKTAELQYKNELTYRSAMEKNVLLAYEADLTNRKVLSGLELVLGNVSETEQTDYMRALHLVTERIVHEDDRAVVYSALNPEHLMNLYREGVTKTEMEYRRNNPDGDVNWVRGTAYLTEDFQNNSIKIFYYVHDINTAKMEMLKLQEKAETDLLTGLYNKVTTEQMVKEAIKNHIGMSCLTAFFIVDMDNFKNINDQLGHAYGDAVLSEIAQNLKSVCRREDIAGRIGGDEFALCLKNLPDMQVVERKAEQICQVFRRAHQNLTLRISGTVGVSVFPSHGQSFEELYKKADLALYTAKERGKDTFCVYSPDMKEVEYSCKERGEVDESSGKTFSENIMEYVFRILYESPNLDMAINGILELISRHFDFSRGYLYGHNTKEGYCHVTAEWCQAGVKPIPDHKRRLEGSDLEVYCGRFGEKGLYIMISPDDIREEDVELAQILGYKYCFQYALTSSGSFQGFLGFDHMDENRQMEPAKVSVLQGVAQMLDVFLSQRHVNDRLEETSRMLQAISDNMKTCTYIIDPETHVLQYINENTSKLLPGAKPGEKCYKAIRGEKKPCEDCPIDSMIAQGKEAHHVEMYLPPYRMWASIDTSMVELLNGKKYALFNGHDFTEYKNLHDEYIVDVEAFTGDASLYRALSASTEDYIYLCDMPKNLFYFPRAMVEEFGIPNQIIEDAIPLWSTYIHPNEQPGFFEDIQRLMDGSSSYHNQEYRARNKNGEWVWLRCRGYVVRDDMGNPTLFAGLITNLQKKGKIDHISGLPNKFEFEQRAYKALHNVKGTEELLLLGLDDFKNINSLYGWAFGDEIIRELAKQMQAILPPQVPIYRMDGDKFGVFLKGDEGITAEEAYNILHCAFQNQREHRGKRYYCTLSGGYSRVKEGDLQNLLKEAEYALEYSKEEGKNRLYEYDPDTMSGRDRMFAIIEKLRESVENGFENFQVYYQPQVNASTKEILGAEALLRWHCEEFGVVSPLEFIPLLESTGLIHTVGQWVLLEAATVCREWRKTIPEFIVSVNVSYVQLKDEKFVEYVAMLVDSDLVNPKSIDLELTESCIMAQDITIAETFRVLREMGFEIALDDFGTGYSSLTILKNAPADVVKLDRSFVKDIINSNFDAAFIQMIVTLCHSVGIAVCLEGVETWDEYDRVSNMGLDYIQGYLFGHPTPNSNFDQFLK